MERSTSSESKQYWRRGRVQRFEMSPVSNSLARAQLYSCTLSGIYICETYIKPIHRVERALKFDVKSWYPTKMPLALRVPLVDIALHSTPARGKHGWQTRRHTTHSKCTASPSPATICRLILTAGSRHHHHFRRSFLRGSSKIHPTTVALSSKDTASHGTIKSA
jgi:hypothetical protein